MRHVATVQSKRAWDAVLEAGRGEQLVATSLRAARPPDLRPVPGDLHPSLREALGQSGIDALYSHQAEALESARDGHTMITTGTASGKSLAFNLPVLDTLAADRAARALYLYPTKALAQDQARQLHALATSFLRPAIYDGDTPARSAAGSASGPTSS